MYERLRTDKNKFRLLENVLSDFSIALLVCLFSFQAFAHPGHGIGNFSGGFFHPLTGIDHLLTAFAVGILAISSDRGFDRRIPVGFMTAMILGIFAGQAEFVLPFYEQGIALSLGFIGICLFVGARLNSRRAVLLAACFGFIHGNAHGVEVGGTGFHLLTTLGLVLSTGGLVGLGVLVAVGMRRFLSDNGSIRVLRFFGAVLVGAAFGL